MTEHAFLRRVEEAQLNSWPALRTVLLDGWVLRAAGGYTNRANSVSPLDPCRAPFAVQLARVATLYAAPGQPALVRTRSFDDPMLLHALREGGWTSGGDSTVLGAVLQPGGWDRAGFPTVRGRATGGVAARPRPPVWRRPGEARSYPRDAGDPVCIRRAPV